MPITRKKIGRNYVLQNMPGDAGNWHLPDTIFRSWDKPISLIAEDESKSVKGFRSAQLGAIYAIKSHWTVSSLPATVVMPTGTGKTETMIATILSERCEKTLIMVPTVLLRDQTVKKCASLGILNDIGVIPAKLLYPAVGCLQKKPADSKELEEIIKESNIIVITVALLKNFDDKYMALLIKNCSTLIIDEAHHIAANTWSEIKSKFSKMRCLQFTATPYRNDGKKIDGKIIYNFPLGQAQRQNYFQPINFVPIYEFDGDKSDLAVAQCAVNALEEDINNKYPHVLLIRAKSKERANILFEKIYKRQYAKHNPVLIISGMGERNKKESLKKIEDSAAETSYC